MKMKPGCETIAKKVVPVLRARIALSLANDHLMQQYEISKLLGVTQAAVSFYLSKARGVNTTMMKTFPEIDSTAKKMASALIKGADDNRMSELLCELCRKIRKKKAFKEFVR